MAARHKAKAAILGQDAEILRQQPGCSEAVGHGLHRADRPDDLPIPQAGKYRASAMLSDAGIEEGEALSG